MTYNELTRRHFETAAHAGVLTGPGIRRGAAGSRRQGTWVQFDVGLHAVRFQAFGCPHVIAVCDWVAQQAVGRVATAGPAAGSAALPESIAELKLRFDVPTEKLGRLLVIEDAWIAAFLPPLM